MEILKIGEFRTVENPTPGKRYRQEILTVRQKAEQLTGILMILAPGDQVPYHYHQKRECIIIGISGEATEIVEGKEIPIKADDILFIPTGEKHGMVNRTDREFRYLEFFTGPPGAEDFIEVK